MPALGRPRCQGRLPAPPPASQQLDFLDVKALLQPGQDLPPSRCRLLPAACCPATAVAALQVVAESREEIVRIFQAWRFANRRLDVDVHEIGGTGLPAVIGRR